MTLYRVAFASYQRSAFEKWLSPSEEESCFLTSFSLL
jgi:hypothetical protein